MTSQIKSLVRNFVFVFASTLPFGALAGEPVQSWVGIVDDLSGYHDAGHGADHPLKFTRASDGESFLIVEGDEGLLKEHLESDKTLEVQIDGRVTSKFLFFGGNLVIEKSKTIQEIAQVEHRKTRSPSNIDRPHGRNNK